MRSGTTSLARYLGAHPDVFMASSKEVHFFDRNFDRGVEWYAGRFAGAAGRRAIGEATQTYMYEAGAVRRIHDTLPDARLIATLRHPVDRAYSHYWLNRSLGSEDLSFEEAIAAEPARLASADTAARRMYSYLDRGRYLRQLETVCDVFPRTSLHVLLFDDLRDDPRGAYQRACSFLGIDPGFTPANLGTPINRFVTFRSQKVRRVAATAPSFVRRILGRVNARPEEYPSMDASLRRDLLARFADDNAALAAWLGRDLPGWDR